MAPQNSKYVSLGVIALTTLLCAVFFCVRVWHLQQAGQTVNYLAELWAPSSVLSIVIVTFVERLTAEPQAAPKASKAPKKRKK